VGEGECSRRAASLRRFQKWLPTKLAKGPNCSVTTFLHRPATRPAPTPAPRCRLLHFACEWPRRDGRQEQDKGELGGGRRVGCTANGTRSYPLRECRQPRPAGKCRAARGPRSVGGAGAPCNVCLSHCMARQATAARGYAPGKRGERDTFEFTQRPAHRLGAPIHFGRLRLGFSCHVPGSETLHPKFVSSQVLGPFWRRGFPLFWVPLIPWQAHAVCQVLHCQESPCARASSVEELLGGIAVRAACARCAGRGRALLRAPS